jgi:iron complex outermembrane receptor protein
MICQKIAVQFMDALCQQYQFYNIPDYVTMDAKLIFKPTKNVELF